MTYGALTMGFIACWVIAGGLASFVITGSVVSALVAMLTVMGFSLAVIAAVLWFEDWRGRG